MSRFKAKMFRKMVEGGHKEPLTKEVVIGLLQDLQRYELLNTIEPMNEDDEGEYVRYEDIEKLIQLIEKSEP